MTAQADIHALGERTARLEERIDAKDEALADTLFMPWYGWPGQFWCELTLSYN